MIDTPGFDDTNKSNAELLRDIALLLGALHIEDVGIIGLIYLHRITDQRVGGSSLRSMQIFQSLCGIQCFPNIVLVTTMWDILEQNDAVDTGLSREEILKEKDEFWGEMVKGEAEVTRHDGQLKSAEAILAKILSRNRTVVMDIQKELVDDDLPLEETKVGRLLLEDIMVTRGRHQRDLSEIQEGLEDAVKQYDEEMIATMAEERRRIEALIEGTEESENRLKSTFGELTHEGAGRAIVIKMEGMDGQEEKIQLLEKRVDYLQDELDRSKDAERKNHAQMRRLEAKLDRQKVPVAKTPEKEHHQNERLELPPVIKRIMQWSVQGPRRRPTASSQSRPQGPQSRKKSYPHAQGAYGDPTTASSSPQDCDSESIVQHSQKRAFHEVPSAKGESYHPVVPSCHSDVITQHNTEQIPLPTRPLSPTHRTIIVTPHAQASAAYVLQTDPIGPLRNPQPLAVIRLPRKLSQDPYGR